MLRNSVRIKINETLSSHERFEAADFQINSVDEEAVSRVQIIYTNEPTYFFEVAIPSSIPANNFGLANSFGTTNFNGQMTPGSLSYTETFVLAHFNEYFQKISLWQSYIWEELLINPVVREQQKQIDEINAEFEKADINSKEYFSKQEAEDFRERLERLEEMFTQQIKDRISDLEQIKEETELLHKDIDTLKEMLPSVNKGSWRRSAITKFNKWISKSENRALLGDGVKVIKGILEDPNTQALLP